MLSYLTSSEIAILLRWNAYGEQVGETGLHSYDNWTRAALEYHPMGQWAADLGRRCEEAVLMERAYAQSKA
jgi:hypothetical protein